MDILIYVIEDDAFIRSTYEKLLSTVNGVKVKAFECGEIALENIQNDKPDITILDYNLNRYSDHVVMNGLSVFRRIKSEWPDSEVIMMSGEQISTLTDEAIEDGVNGFINKNEFSLLTLKNLITNIIRDSKRA